MRSASETRLPSGDRLQPGQHVRQPVRLVDLPVFLRRQAQARAVRPAPMVRAPVGRGGGPGGRDQGRHVEAGVEDLGLQCRDVRIVDRRVIAGGDRILPDQLLGRYLGAEVAGARAHVAVGQLEPGPGEGVGELIRVLVAAPGNRFVDRVHPQGQVGGGRDRRVPGGGIVGIRHAVGAGTAAGRPLLHARGTFHQFPLVAEEDIEKAVVPAAGIGRPGPFDAAGDGIDALAGGEAALPAKALFLDRCALGFRADQGVVVGAVAFAEGVAAGDQCHGLLVVHRHPGEGVANVAGRGEGIGIAVRAFRVDVDQTHLHGCQRRPEIPLALIARVAQPFGFPAPVDIRLRCPDVLAPVGEAEGLEAHRFQCAVAGEDHQVGPAVEGSETQAAAPRPARRRCVGARAVPGHAYEQWPIVAIVRWPPVLRGGHQVDDVLFYRRQVQAFEGCGIVEIRAHGIERGVVLVENVEPQPIRPPLPVRGAPAGRLLLSVARHRAFALRYRTFLLSHCAAGRLRARLRWSEDGVV